MVGMLTITEETRAYIRAHEDGDVRDLALHAPRDGGVDLPFALDQIAGRRMARAKLPRWAACDGIVYPPHLSMEQCSGGFAADYKREVAARLVASTPRERRRLMDLTGGFGVDFAAMAGLFAHATYVERQPSLCDIARHNLPLLGLPHAQVVEGDGLEALAALPDGSLTMAFVDPARRDAHGSRTYAVADCTPDVLAARDLLLARARIVMLKLSPMLDWRRAAEEFGDAVREVHIVATGNECKDLLLVLMRPDASQAPKHTQAGAAPRVFAVNDGQRIDFVHDATRATAPAPAAQSRPRACLQPGGRLYEPNAAVMKAGCFDLLESRFGVRAVARNSHLFTSDRARPDFPGRGFVIDRVSTMNNRQLREAMAGVERANVAVRNFPLTAPALRRRLRVGDGGDVYLFATTDEAGRHLVLVTRKED